MTDVLIGLEVFNLGGLESPDAPWRMTVDCWVDGKIKRYQITGQFNGGWEGAPDRTIEEVAAVQANFSRATEIATEFDRLDREYAEKVAPLAEQLFRDQVFVVHGQEGLDFLDREEVPAAFDKPDEPS